MSAEVKTDKQPIPLKSIPQDLSVLNFFKVFSFLIPLLLVFCIILYSVFANNLLKGLIFLSGIVIVVFINTLLKNLIKEKSGGSIYCNFFPTPFSSFNSPTLNYSNPSVNATLISFCAIYLLYPGFMNKKTNIFLIILFALLFLINIVTDYMEGCSTLISLILGTSIGLFSGYIYYLLIKSKDTKSLNLSDFLAIKSNKAVCSEPEDQKYKCSILNKKKNKNF